MPDALHLPGALHGRGARRARGLQVAAARALGMVLALALVIAPAIAQGREATPTAADPALEARVMTIAEELRCVVCQNETLAASQADLARDLRAQIRLQLQQGRTREEIMDFMVTRYGEFVLYRPPLQATTLVLWTGPFVLLVLASGWLVLGAGRRRRAADGLTADELRRVQELLDERRPG